MRKMKHKVNPPYITRMSKGTSTTIVAVPHRITSPDAPNVSVWHVTIDNKNRRVVWNRVEFEVENNE